MSASESPDGGFALPLGTVTLLLADIETSTRLWEERPGEMTAAVAELDRAVADAIGRHEGVRPVEQGEGDSFVAAFSRASDAIACGLTLQLALVNGPLRLRMGIHTGEVQLRDEGNYVGPAVNRAARVRNVGHGGQVLLSQTAADLVLDRLPAQASLVDLGVHRLRDLGRPEHIWQLAHPDLPSQFAPLVTLDAVRNNLPVQLTSFVGRHDDVAEVDRLLDDARMVTLTGAGGCGKTRLALQAAADRLDRHPDGVWFVELSALNEAALVAQAVAEALSVREQPGGSAVAAVSAAIGDKAVLLVLDNCEHLIEPSAQLAQRLLTGCPALTVMATSREPLGVSGEVTFRTPSLSFPSDDEPAKVEALGHYEAVQLFVERARRARPRFSLDDANSSAVAEICRRLDGIPLAIELAAARVRVLTPAQIRDGLHDRFRLLTGGPRTAVPRQQTLQASVDWSYRLLLEAERALLRRLSVFAGGFTLDAAEFVGAGDGIEAHHVLDLLSQLVDKSLVVLDEDAAEGRFRLLETVRQYAASRLADAEEAGDARRRHFEFFLGVATLERGESDDAYRTRVTTEYENIRRALQWAADCEEALPILRLTARLFTFWAWGTRLRDGWHWTEIAIERAPVDDPVRRARALRSYAYLRALTGDWSAPPLRHVLESLELSRGLEDTHGTVDALTMAGNIEMNSGLPQAAREHLEEAVRLAREVGYERGLAFALFAAGLEKSNTDPAAARVTLDEAIQLGRKVGVGYVERMATATLGVACAQDADPHGAIRYSEQALPMLRAAGDGFYLMATQNVLVSALAQLGDVDRAGQVCDEMQELAAQMGDEGSLARSVSARALVAATKAEWATARRLSETIGSRASILLSTLATLMDRDVDAAEAYLEREAAKPTSTVGPTPPPDWRSAFLDCLRAIIGRAKGDLTLAEQLAHDALTSRPGAGIDGVLLTVLDLLAALAADNGNWDEAARIFGGADSAFNARFGEGRWWVRGVFDAAREATQQALGTERFESARAEGAALSTDELLTYVRRGRGERKRPSSGWESLTPAELSVAKLVADGLSSPKIAERLFVSPRTITTHLSHIFAKLGISSRAELSAGFVRRGASLE
jgi:pentatricopeptide repeat protein